MSEEKEKSEEKRGKRISVSVHFAAWLLIGCVYLMPASSMELSCW